MKRKSFAVLLTIVSMALLFACGGGSGGSDLLPEPNPLPVLTLDDASNITAGGASIKVNFSRVSSPFSEYGIILNGTKISGANKSSSSYAMDLGLLDPKTKYTYKAYVVVLEGTAYSIEKSFTTLELKEITDIDGNKIPIVTIGTGTLARTWTAADWKAKKYNDGTPIFNAVTADDWKNSSSGAWCYYENNANLTSVLYDWYAISNPKGLAPAGWHIANDVDWASLDAVIGNDANKLKEVGKAHWLGTNASATNSTGFTAISTGYRDPTGAFVKGGFQARWFTGEVDGRTNYVNYDESTFIISSGSGRKISGAVRLVKN